MGCIAMDTGGLPLLLIFGLLFLLGLGADLAGRRTAIPRVTLLILAGIIVFLMGLLSEQLTNLQYKDSDPKPE